MSNKARFGVGDIVNYTGDDFEFEVEGNTLTLRTGQEMEITETLGYSEEQDDYSYRAQFDVDGDPILIEVAQIEIEGKPKPKAKAKETAPATQAPAKGKSRAKAEEAPATKEPAPKGRKSKVTETESEEPPPAKSKAPAKSKSTVQESPEEKPQKTKDLAPVVLKNEDQDILDMVAAAQKSKDGLIGFINKRVQQVTITEYELGGLLHHLQLGSEYQDLSEDYQGVGGFERCIDREFGLGYRKALNLITIYRVFNKYGITGATVASLGWSKAARIAAVADQCERKGIPFGKKDLNALLNLAGANSVKALEDHIKKTYKTAGGVHQEFHKLPGFSLPKERADITLSYVNKASANFGISDYSQTLERIIAEWAEDHLE